MPAIWTALYDAVKTVFGIVAVSRAAACEKDKGRDFKNTAQRYLGDRLGAAKSFKVETKRADKRFPHDVQLSCHSMWAAC